MLHFQTDLSKMENPKYTVASRKSMQDNSRGFKKQSFPPVFRQEESVVKKKKKKSVLVKLSNDINSPSGYFFSLILYMFLHSTNLLQSFYPTTNSSPHAFVLFQIPKISLHCGHRCLLYTFLDLKPWWQFLCVKVNQGELSITAYSCLPPPLPHLFT